MRKRVNEKQQENESSRVRKTKWGKHMKEKGSGWHWEKEIDRKRLPDYWRAGLVIHERGL